MASVESFGPMRSEFESSMLDFKIVRPLSGPNRPMPAGFLDTPVAQAVRPAANAPLPARRPADAADFAAPLRQACDRAGKSDAAFRPMAYPASNAPAMWTYLHPLIARSPLLGTQLAQLSQARWSVHWSHGAGSCCKPFSAQIRVDTSQPATVAQFLAHEASHAFDVPVYFDAYSSEIDYADAMMRNEALAVINQLRVRDEILANGGVDIGISHAYPLYYDAAIRFYRRHGDIERLIGHIKQMYGWQSNSLDGSSYWQFICNEYRARRGWPRITLPRGLIAFRQDEAARQLGWEIRLDLASSA